MGNKFNGFGGMNGGNFNNILKQAQKMQQELLEKQQEVESQTFESSVGGGAVTVKVSGAKAIKELTIKPEVLDPDDVEMLQDLIITCVNEALRKVDSAQAQQFGKFNIPGLM